MAKKRKHFPSKIQKIEYRGAVEGFQEEKYFKHLASLIEEEPKRKYDVRFKLTNVEGGSPLVVARKASNQQSAGKIDRIAVFDFDLLPKEYAQAIDHCKKNQVVAAYSNMCFDLWLLLHKTSYNKGVVKSEAYQEEVIQAYGLKKGDNIKSEEIMEQIVSQITLKDVCYAVKRGNEIEETNKQFRTPLYTEKSIQYFENPDLNIHHFVKKVLQKTKIK